MSRQQITPPAALPVTLGQLKAQLRIEADNDAEDAILTTYLAAAVRTAERWLCRQLITAAWRIVREDFPAYAWITLDRPPLQSVTSVTYVDPAGVRQTLSTDVYRADTQSDPGRIVLQYNQSWPACRRQSDSVQITYVAGYGDDPADVPADYQLAILTEAAAYHRHREIDDELSPAVRALLGGRNYQFA